MFLKPPTAADIRPKKRRKGLSLPTQEFKCLVVIDLEWNTDNKPNRIKPEIIELSACVVRLGEKQLRPFQTSRFQEGLEPEIQLYCKPTEAKQLTAFIKKLTGISQEIVDSSPSFEKQLEAFVAWLVEQDLIDATSGNKLGHWSMCSWSDADVDMIRREAERKGFLDKVPVAFHTWVNLKDDAFFKKVYGVAARGGLENCCKNICKVGFSGRAHGGLTDARNTAAVAADMANQLFRFTRHSRGFDRNGVMFGSKRQRT